LEKQLNEKVSKPQSSPSSHNSSSSKRTTFTPPKKSQPTTRQKVSNPEVPQADQPSQSNSPKNVSQSRKPSMILIGDSITNSLDTKVIAQASDSTIKKVKAYSSVHDEDSNIAKQAARYPQHNYTDVAQIELGKKQFDILLLQAGSVDITNLNTKSNPTEHFDYFNQQTVLSAKNLFSVAVNALSTHHSLQKVVIFKQIPRYDTTHADPLQLKPALSQIFNNTLTSG
jgi:hypothetical protein